jgi:hypothetical protein
MTADEERGREKTIAGQEATDGRLWAGSSSILRREGLLDGFKYFLEALVVAWAWVELI